MKNFLKSCLLLVFLLLVTNSSVLADSAVPAAYKSLFNTYKNSLYDGTYNESELGSVMIADNPFDLSGTEATDFLGYDFSDINGDGITEFIVGFSGTDADHQIAIYTLENNSPKLLKKTVASPLQIVGIMKNLPDNPDISNTIADFSTREQINNDYYSTDVYYKLNGTNLEFSASYSYKYTPNVVCYKSTDPNNRLQTQLDSIPEILNTGRLDTAFTPFTNYVDIPDEGPEGSIYRVCNVTTNEHLYTLWHNEAVELCKSGAWRNEGIAWTAPNTSDTPIYRLYNAQLDDHLYTSDPNEVRILTTEQNWASDNNGNPVFYSGGDIPIYRLYNPTNYRHLLTRDENEYNTLLQFGWQQEDVAIHAVS